MNQRKTPGPVFAARVRITVRWFSCGVYFLT
jgi:hypothetical protein